METAISVPDPVFEEGERLAERLGVSRSHLYSIALREYLRQHDDDEVTRRLNEVYDREPSEPDPVLLKIASRALLRESWK
jgi:metal-responsive CopG/Arc/MetJ family transcriptional regulator